MPPASPNNQTVFVVDDDPELRESLKSILEKLHFEVRAFSTAGNFYRYYRRDMPGCLILDMQLPRQTGLELYEQLLKEGKRLPVIFITGHADVGTAVAAMKTGAVEFLEKPFDIETLFDRVRSALQLDAQWRERQAEIRALECRIAKLSERERETLDMIQRGLSNKQMAARLFLSERAVEMRRSAIMRKLEVSSVAELLELAITNRILGELGMASVPTSRKR